MPVYRTPNPQHRPPAAAAPGAPARPARDVDVISHSLDQTRRIGQRLAALLEPGDLILLEGPFGAGKTTFTQGIARGLGVESEYITSPTFTLINEYAARLPLYHVDLYRLQTAQEAGDLGLLDYVTGDGVTVIEWPERAAGLLPAAHLTIYLSDIAETKRALRFHAAGARYTDLLERFKSQAFAPGAVPDPGAPPARGTGGAG
ncbi:MAG TPA: tRNA (adenosine(37)-N6)-threonylcarbamoyltransferase complex ATPase subunit type 1 TsaE [Chloroflexia bacterium]|nr:tRNA (adenosine(37)-N6)-threonylcarbamoyltransferase complex ATPase subunit type 1 TsaE [Chloroflexia bacterium]